VEVDSTMATNTNNLNTSLVEIYGRVALGYRENVRTGIMVLSLGMVVKDFGVQSASWGSSIWAAFCVLCLAVMVCAALNK
jgi:hypothetical protein